MTVTPQIKVSSAKPHATAVQSSGKTVSASPRAKKGNGAAMPDDVRRNYIEVAAYHMAEQRGFESGSELDDWLQAEREVDRQLREGLLEF